MQPPLHGRQRQVQKLRNASDGHFVEVAQLQDDLKLLRQLRHRLAHVALVLFALDLFGGVLRQFGGVLKDERVNFRMSRFLLMSAILTETERAVSRDGVQPRAELVSLLQLRERLKR